MGAGAGRRPDQPSRRGLLVKALPPSGLLGHLRLFPTCTEGQSGGLQPPKRRKERGQSHHVFKAGGRETPSGMPTESQALEGPRLIRKRPSVSVPHSRRTWGPWGPLRAQPFRWLKVETGPKRKKTELGLFSQEKTQHRDEPTKKTLLVTPEKLGQVRGAKGWTCSSAQHVHRERPLGARRGHRRHLVMEMVPCRRWPSA